MEYVRRQEVRELARLTAQLSCAQQTFFQAEYGRHRRNPTTALLLCILLGDFGAHYFYFGRHRGGIVRLLFCWTLVPWVIALFEARTITSRALRYNASLANELALAIERADVERRASDEAEPHTRGAVTPQTQPLAPLPPLPPLPPLHAEPEPAAPLAAAEALAVPAALTLVTVASSEPAEGAAVDDAPAAEPEPVESLARVPAAADEVDELDSAESHLIAAAWAGREPALDDPSDPPLPLEALEPYASGSPASYGREDDAQLTAEPGLAYAPMFALEAADGVELARWEDAGASMWPWPATSSDAAETPADEAVAYAAAPMQEQPRDQQDEPLPWFVADATPRPAVSAAVAQAAATWADAANEPGNAAAPDAGAAPEPTVQVTQTADASEVVQAEKTTPGWQSTDPVQEPAHAAAPAEPAAETHEPVFMYQIAAPPRREAVRVMPSPAEYQEEETVTTAAPNASHGASGRDDLGLAAIGSALAAGLAELLRERPSRPRSPITTPFGEPDAPATPAPSATPDQAAVEAPARRDALDTAAEQTLPSQVEQSPAASGEAGAPWQSDWTPTDVWASDTPAAPAPADEQPRAGVHEPAAGPAEWPAALALAAVEPALQAGAPAVAPPESEQAVQGSNMVGSTEAYPSSRSRNLRRRVMQRVIVRKMAVLDGHVVAESTAERQVPVIPDEREMSARVQAATTEAAREALHVLMERSPEEARPSIRMQLYALDTPASGQSFQAPAGSGSGSA